MNKRCKETYKKTLQEVLGFIVKMPGKSIVEIVNTLNYAINSLENKKPKDEIKIIFDDEINK